MHCAIVIRARERAANAVSLDYSLRLKTIANDTVLEVRDSAQSSQSDWKRAHDDLVRLAKQRAGLDWEEGRSLVCALRSQSHRRLGYGSFVEYIERIFGYSPRFTMEKVRVAEALEVLTEMAQALKDGEVCWSALRELTRAATRRTEGEWLRAARGRTVRQIEQMVSGRKPGDGPDDPADEAHRRHVIRLEVSGATYATFREMMAKIRREAGEPLDDDAALMMMARQVLGGPKDPGRSSYQVKLDVCENCRRGWQEGRGQTVEVPPEVVEMAECDGQQIGVIPSRVDTHVAHAPTEPSTKPARATQSIPPSVRRKVLRRDRGCCVVPGCTHGSFLDVHHIKPREEGGGHDADQLVTLCGAHHAAVHQGRIVIEGRASERLEFFHADGTSYGRAVSPDTVDLKTKAFQALKHMGFKETEARRALDAISSHVGALTLENILRQALLVLT
jgi:hypothetical protein